jgi:hypothetical protein
MRAATLNKELLETSGRARALRRVAPAAVLLVAAAVYVSIYSRDETLPTAIGANLVPAERVLEGEIPYRDFYKIQTPGILLLNAALFKLFGTSLLTAMTGVLAFKTLTVLMVFLTARLVVSQAIALIPAMLTFVWLTPGGPFRPAPIQYEMLFIIAATYFTLKWMTSRRALHIFAAGLSVGLIAVFKQNVGVYSALALALSLVLRDNPLPRSFKDAKRIYVDSWKTAASAHIAAAAGVAVPLAAMVAYLAINRALSDAIRVFIEGPGTHIQMKFTGYPLPKHAAVIFVAGAIALTLGSRFIRKWPDKTALIIGSTFFGAAACAALVPQGAIDNSIYWFAPALFIAAIWQYVRASGDGQRNSARGALLVLLLFSMASYGEVFPRSVRGLIIGTLPPAFLLLAFLLGRNEPANQADEKARFNFASKRALALGLVSLVFFIFAMKTVLPRYFYLDAARFMKFKPDTELGFDRGRGVYLPARRAEEANATVDFIRARTGEGGYFFAHALDSASYYFLADRNSPTGATLWNDAGTNDRERERTMIALRDKSVRLVVTNEQALKTESYQPMVEYLNNDFHEVSRVGNMIFLERNY